ncbi:MAG: hypothetical protein R2724_17220 [Bryobacterales bacterium]
MELDWYYRDLAHLDPQERARWNFDHPDALDWELLRDQLIRLRAGEPIAPPLYDFSTHTRRAAYRAVGPASLIVLEGILALHQRALREAMDLSIFVAAPEPVRLSRRLERDVRERGRTRNPCTSSLRLPSARCTMRSSRRPRRTPDLVADGEGTSRRPSSARWRTSTAWRGRAQRSSDVAPRPSSFSAVRRR